MSFVAVVRTNHGIVMSADKRLSLDFTEKAPNGQIIIRRKVISDCEQKLFEIGSYGLSYFGDNVGEPMSVTIKHYAKNMAPKIAMMDCAESLLDTVRSKSEEPTRTIFYLCGYENTDDSHGTILRIDVAENKIITISKDSIVIMGGDLNELTNLFCNIPTDRVKYNIGNAKEYLKFLTLAASNYQRFACRAETISPECDFLVLPRP